MTRSLLWKNTADSVEPSTSRARIDSVDGLRALAFMLVLAVHTWESADRPDVSVVSAGSRR